MESVIHTRWSFMAAFYAPQPGPELVTASGAQTNQATDFRGTPSRNRQWTPGTRENLGLPEGAILLAKPF